MSAKRRIPSYRLHKSDGRAVVTIDGRDIYLGKHGTAGSRQAYDRLISEWLANNRRLPAFADEPPQLTVNEIVVAFMKHARQYYRKNGEETSSVSSFAYAFNYLRNLYGNTLAADLRPRHLKAVRHRMIESGLRRKVINDRIWRIKHLFRWCAGEELVDARVADGLADLGSLKKGRHPGVPESQRVKPVDVDEVEATLPYVAPQVAAMVRLQLLTGMRPGEVITIKTRHLDLSGDEWIYRPDSHKTEHHGDDGEYTREIVLGPKAQAVVRPWLRAAPDEYLFQPREAEENRRRRMRSARKTKVQPSQRNRKKTNPKHGPGDHYDVRAYRHAIHRACDKVGINRWSPNRLRHTCATILRKKYGIEGARIVLGHRSAMVTEIYAEIDKSMATKIMLEVG